MLDDGPTLPHFRTQAQRDDAYARWCRDGGTMRSGMTCSVAGALHVYRDGEWRRA